MKRSKILIDCSPISKGGGLQVVIATLESLLKNDKEYIYKVIIPKSIFNYLPKSIQKNINVYWISKNNFYDKLKLILILYFITFKFKPKLVYTIFGPQYFLPFTKHLVGFAKPSLIYPKIQVNNNLSKSIKDFISKIIFKYSNFYIVETETVKINLSKTLNIKKEKIFIIKNSINPQLIEIKQKNFEKKVKEEFVKILVPSAYYPHKNLESLIKISLNLLKIRSDFKFFITIDHKTFKNKFYSIIKGTKIEKNIINLGPQKIKSLAHYYLNSDMVFLPTLLECSTAVYPEAFYFKLPLITSNLQFAKELCGDAALFCNPNDPEDCAEKIINLLNDFDLSQKLIKNGEKQLSNYLNVNERGIYLEKIFRELI